jgi:CRP-like cAMP-binding protein/predicted GNAT family N-acyltransferase
MINKNPKTMSYTTETTENSIKICIAITPEEKREIYHFRYQTYVEEMSKHIEEGDYANKLLYDELDEWALLLYAKIGSVIIATERINIGTLADFPQKVVDILSLNEFQNCYTEHGDQKFAYITKLMVAPSHRGSPVLYLLMAECYEICCHRQIQFGFGICNFYLLRLYEQMGFHRYCKNFVYPGHGLAVPIVLLADDIQHFRIIRSPLLRIARKKGALNTQEVEWFHDKFTRNSPIINSQTVTEEELWSILCKGLNSPPTEAIALLQELSEAEAKKFLHSCGSYVQCASGDIITSQGDFSYSYDILISGKLKSLTFHHPIKEYTLSGQHFGANGLTEHNKHTEDIAAVTSTQLLVLSGAVFPRFFHSHPEIAHKIVKTMNSITKNKLINIKWA